MIVRLEDCLGKPDAGNVLRLLGMSPDIGSFIRKVEDQVCPRKIVFTRDNETIIAEDRISLETLLSEAEKLPGTLRLLPNEGLFVVFDAETWELFVDAGGRA